MHFSGRKESAATVLTLLQFVTGTACGALLILLVTGILYFSKSISVSRPGSIKPSPYRWMTHPLPLFIFAALEELFARAFLIGWLQKLTGLDIAFAISVIVFTLLHVPNRKPTVISILNLVAISVLFGDIYLQYGLWAVVGVHYGWNLTQWTLLGYPMYGNSVGRVTEISPSNTVPQWLHGGDCGPEFSAIALVVIVSALSFIYTHGTIGKLLV
jgi:membrane protease YdiL (CAAX protease family)